MPLRSNNSVKCHLPRILAIPSCPMKIRVVRAPLRAPLRPTLRAWVRLWICVTRKGVFNLVFRSPHCFTSGSQTNRGVACHRRSRKAQRTIFIVFECWVFVASVLSMVHKEMKTHSTWSSHETAHGKDNHNTALVSLMDFIWA